MPSGVAEAEAVVTGGDADAIARSGAGGGDRGALSQPRTKRHARAHGTDLARTPTTIASMVGASSGRPVRYTSVGERSMPNPFNLKLGQTPRTVEPAPAPAPPPESVRSKVRGFVGAHGRKLWWLHSAYALALGTGVVVFARKGFLHARWLAVSLGLAWLLLVLLFRVRGAVDARPRAGFYVMTYALKNLYQGMLFFLLPFYWKSTTPSAQNGWFVVLLGACAVISTLDIVFDHVLMRWRWLASSFHGLALFACLNLVIPALFPDTRTLWSLLLAASFAVVSFWTLHVTAIQLRKRATLGLFAASLVAGVGLAYAGRVGIPPVPMYVSSAGVGPKQLPDGRLAMEVTTLHPSVIQELIAVTDVVVPGGKGDRLRHVWRHDGLVVHRTTEETSRIDGPKGIVRLRSSLTDNDLPRNLLGEWHVDVETDDGQLVGRTEFRVVE